MTDIPDPVAHACEIRRRIRDHSLLKDCLEQSGSVFFSERETLRRGLVYFLGMNPGGAPDGSDDGESLGRNFVPGEGESAWYEEWLAGKPGEHPFQRLVKNFLGSLRREIGVLPGTQSLLARKWPRRDGTEYFIRSICSSNLCFLRSPTLGKLGMRLEDATAWDIHEYMINRVVKPSLILINGLGAYDAFRKRWRLPGGRGETLNTGKRSKVRLLPVEGDKLLVGIPHLSPKRPYHMATESDAWRAEGLPALRERCHQAVRKRPADGCAWPLPL